MKMKGKSVDMNKSINSPHVPLESTIKFRGQLGKWDMPTSAFRSGGVAAGDDRQHDCSGRCVVLEEAGEGVDQAWAVAVYGAT